MSGLSFTYGTRLLPALRDLSFEVSPGETVLVLGPSGSGKSTLTLCVDGLIPHVVQGDYAGEVTVAGLVVKETPVRVLARQAALVFQDPESQFCTLTVEDEVAFGLENLQAPPAEIEAAIDRALAAVGLPGHRARRLGGLSGGEKQRVALAAVLAMGARLLVLDEPSANLDPAATRGLFSILRGLAAGRRHTILIIEHKLEEVIDWVDSVLVLDAQGRLLFRGDPRSAFYDHVDLLAEAGVWRPKTTELVTGLRAAGWKVPGSPLAVGETVAALRTTPGLIERLRLRFAAGAACEAASLGTAGAGAACCAAVAGSAATPLAEAPATMAVAAPVSRGTLGSRAADAPLLSVQGLSFAYPGGHIALTDVSFTVRRGDFLAIVGANAAGKTTLGSLVSGVLPAPKGRAFLEGVDIAGLSAWAIAKKVGYVFQNPEHQFVSDTVQDELAFSLAPRGRGRPGRLTGAQRQLVDDWLDRLELLHLARANPFSLSQGQKRRLSVAAMLIRGCPFLILDEPTLGQDEALAARLMEMMREFQAEGGTVAMITHDMGIVAEYASRVLVLAAGRVLFCGDPVRLFAMPAVVEEAGLAMPAVAQVALELLAGVGTRARLLTVADFLNAAGEANG